MKWIMDKINSSTLWTLLSVNIRIVQQFWLETEWNPMNSHSQAYHVWKLAFLGLLPYDAGNDVIPQLPNFAKTGMRLLHVHAFIIITEICQLVEGLKPSWNIYTHAEWFYNLSYPLSLSHQPIATLYIIIILLLLAAGQLHLLCARTKGL